MPKYPYMQMFWRDFLYDRTVMALSPLGFRLWTYALGAMWEDDRSGRLCGTVDDLARIAGMLPAEVEKALDDIRRCNTGAVEVCNGVVTLENRRMVREAAERVRIGLAVRRLRHKSGDVTDCNGGDGASCNGDVTDTRARAIGVSSSSAALIPETLQQQQQHSDVPTNEPAASACPGWITPAMVRDWFASRLKSRQAAGELAERWVEFNAHIDHWAHATPANWRYFCARYLAEEIRRNGHPDKRFFAFRSAGEKKQVDALANEERADADTVADALQRMRAAFGKQ